MKRAWVLIGEGVEELEAVGPIDLLRRAAVDCQVVSCEAELLVKGRNALRLEADLLLSEVGHGGQPDLLVVPGGPGVAKLRQDRRVLALLGAQHQAERLIGAICAAPTVLLAAGILSAAAGGIRHTAHCSVSESLPQLLEQKVVRDKHVITSRGAGTVLEFGLALVAALVDSETANDISTGIHY